MIKRFPKLHKREMTILWLLLTSLAILLIAYHCPLYLNDDSYITLTYVKNLVRGNGFVFNHPPPVLGTTTPLFTLLTTALAKLFPFVNLVRIAIFFSAFSWLGIAWLFFLFREAWHLTDWQVCILASAILGWGWIGLLGMEAFLFAFLLILSISLMLDGRVMEAGFSTGLLFLTRGEGVLILPLFALAILVKAWPIRKRELAKWLTPLFKLGVGFAIPTLAWMAYATFTFGSFLPNTLAAKQAQGQTVFGKSFLSQLFTVWIPAWTRAFGFKPWPFLNLWWFAIVVGIVSALHRRKEWALLSAWGLAYIAGYAFLGVSTYGWYKVPVLFILDLLFAIGVIALIEFTLGHVPSPYGKGLVAGILILSALTLARPAINGFRNYHGDSRGKSYIALAQWFQEHAEPSESIAYLEIGYLGYYTDNRIVDLAGLILPDIPPHIAEGDFTWGFWAYEPDYYVYLPDFDWALGDIRADPRFNQQYRAVATLPGPRTSDFTIYRRVPPGDSSSPTQVNP